MSLQSDTKKALELMNSGQWLQLEGTVGRWVQGFIDAEYLVQDFDKTKKSVESLEKEVVNQRNNLNAIYGAMQQTEKLLKLSRGEEDGKKV